MMGPSTLPTSGRTNRRYAVIAFGTGRSRGRESAQADFAPSLPRLQSPVCADA